MQQYTIHPLAVGINETDQGVMTYLRDYGKRIHLPIFCCRCMIFLLGSSNPFHKNKGRTVNSNL
jgi:hypothetical protein